MNLTASPAFAGLHAWFDAWQHAGCQAQTWAATLDPAGTGQAQRATRLARLIAVAQARSPFYARRLRGATHLEAIQPVTRAELMQDFDHWATDRRITRDAVMAWLAETAHVGQAWLGEYLVWTSSGTSGEPGVFVQDAASLAAYDALDALRLRAGGATQLPLGLWGLGRRFAYVGATGGHFAGHASLARLQRLAPPGFAPDLHVLSVLDPLDRIAAQLQALRPQVLITYPSAALALAERQDAGALRLALAELWLGGEQLTAEQRQRLQASFGCPVRNSYGASECFSIAFECAHGTLHLNSDWVVLEAVDAQLRPVAPGALSQHTLLTNLANLTQPLLRYRLDDRVRLLPGRCACGSAFPMLAVQGRSDDTLSLPGATGGHVTVLPLALETAIEEGAGVTRFQLRQRRDGALELRLEAGVGDAAAALARCRRATRDFLARQGAAAPRIVASRQPPLQQTASGKLRRVVAAGQRG